MPTAGLLFFMYATMLIAVPTGVKVFNWLATMWRGAMTFETPMLFAIGFLFLFTLGGFTGLVLSIMPVDVQVQDTYYVVAHFHYVMVAGSLFAFFGGAYYWIPKWSGTMYNETLGKVHFWSSLISFNVDVLPDALPGPRRNAAPDSRLRAAVRRLEHGRVDRRVLVRRVAAPVPVLDGPVRPRQGREGAGAAVGRRRHARMDAAVAGAVPHVRDAAGRQVTPARRADARCTRQRSAASDAGRRLRASNRRTALVLAAIAVMFFVGIIGSKFMGGQATRHRRAGRAVLLYPRASPSGATCATSDERR